MKKDNIWRDVFLVILFILSCLILMYFFKYNIEVKLGIVDNNLNLILEDSRISKINTNRLGLIVVDNHDNVIYEGPFKEKIELPLNDEFSKRTIEANAKFDGGYVYIDHSAPDLSKTSTTYSAFVRYYFSTFQNSIIDEAVYEINNVMYLVNGEKVDNPIPTESLDEVNTLQIEHVSLGGAKNIHEMSLLNPSVEVIESPGEIKVLTKSADDVVSINGEVRSTISRYSLSDENGPNKVKAKISKHYDSGSVEVSISETTDKETVNKLSIEVKNSDYTKNMVHEVSYMSGVRSYYYAIHTGDVTDISKMRKANSLNFTQELEPGDYILSIIAVDNHGNLSEISNQFFSL